MEIASTHADTPPGETQAPVAPTTSEKEKQGDEHTRGPPLISPPVQLIGINYIPDSTNIQTTSLPAPSHPTPWEESTSASAAATTPSFVQHGAIGLSTFPPKPQVKRLGAAVSSSYRFGPIPPDSAYYTPPVGQIGLHHPREIVRVERDYSGGEIVQFSSSYLEELEGRISPRQFIESINVINEILISAYSLRRSIFDNCVEIFTLQLSRLLLSTHYEREMNRLERRMDELNRELFNPVGLRMIWPRKVGFLFLEIEYYVSSHRPFLRPGVRR
ncbi:Golgin subfamily A member 7/ERF4 family-domain-containing protein [Russula earlei]|uniref:Golgin subfamily A member 7/ERF4 family-domain-containing protein n=1 Tax=Russula earlei TaxID=71964 RepID=A0ACC0UL64_9AGAM|nr:Golgin subfamily A member 7/ERF4 family-domain-containing protein [Russula earlei]